jgi:hypothetical protein
VLCVGVIELGQDDAAQPLPPLQACGGAGGAAKAVSRLNKVASSTKQATVRVMQSPVRVCEPGDGSRILGGL